MWCLGRLLPVMLGECVPKEDEKWECFLLLLTIVDYIFAPVISKNTLPGIGPIPMQILGIDAALL